MAVGPRKGPFRGPQPTRRRLIQAAVVATAPLFLDWFTPLSTPSAYQVEPGLSAAWQQYFSGVTVPASTVTTDWLRPLSEPARTKPDIRWREPFVTDSKWQAPPEVDWRTPFSEPVRSKVS